MNLLLNVVLVPLFFAVGAATVIFGLAGRWGGWNVWAYVGLVLGVFLVQILGTSRTSPDFLKERIQQPTRGRVRVPAAGAMRVVSIAQWSIAGLDHRVHWSDSVPPTGVVAGLLIVTIGVALMTWSVLVNPFFSPVVRIQAERGQRVISAGPYRIVRHPGSAGLLLWAVASGVALNALLSIIPIVALAVPSTVYQTLIEDRMLHDELAGYADDAAQTR